MTQAHRLRAEIETLYETIRNKTKELDKMEGECAHDWEEIQFTPLERRYEYKDYLPEGPQTFTEKRWTRICRNCGVKQMTDYEPKNGIWTRHPSD